MKDKINCEWRKFMLVPFQFQRCIDIKHIMPTCGKAIYYQISTTFYVSGFADYS